MIMGMMMIMGPMPAPRLEIGAALGVERGLDRPQPAAEPRNHRFDDVVAADAQPAAGNLHRQVAVAEMPGEAQQVFGAFGTDFGQRLGGPYDLDQAAIGKAHGIAGAKGDRFRQIEQELQPADRLKRDPAAVAVVEIEHDGIRRLPAPIAAGDDLGRVQHVKLQRVQTFRPGMGRSGTRLRWQRTTRIARTGRLVAIIPTTRVGRG